MPSGLRNTLSEACLCKTYNYPVRLANDLEHDNITITQTFTQKPLRVLQDVTEKAAFYIGAADT